MLLVIQNKTQLTMESRHGTVLQAKVPALGADRLALADEVFLHQEEAFSLAEELRIVLRRTRVSKKVHPEHGIVEDSERTEIKRRISAGGHARCHTGRAPEGRVRTTLG